MLINHRTDVALAVGADGVHLTGTDIAASDARALAARALAAKSSPAAQFLIAASCHSAQEVRLAEAHGADFAVLAPIFEKVNVVKNGIGLEELRRATRKEEKPICAWRPATTAEAFRFLPWEAWIWSALRYAPPPVLRASPAFGFFSKAPICRRWSARFAGSRPESRKVYPAKQPDVFPATIMPDTPILL